MECGWEEIQKIVNEEICADLPQDALGQCQDGDAQTETDVIVMTSLNPRNCKGFSTPTEPEWGVAA